MSLFNFVDGLWSLFGTIPPPKVIIIAVVISRRILNKDIWQWKMLRFNPAQPKLKWKTSLWLLSKTTSKCGCALKTSKPHCQHNMGSLQSLNSQYYCQESYQRFCTHILGNLNICSGLVILTWECICHFEQLYTANNDLPCYLNWLLAICESDLYRLSRDTFISAPQIFLSMSPLQTITWEALIIIVPITIREDWADQKSGGRSKWDSWWFGWRHFLARIASQQWLIRPWCCAWGYFSSDTNTRIQIQIQ